MPWCAVNPLTCPQAVCNVESVSTTCWDDCTPYSPETQMDELLHLRSSKQCARTARSVAELAGLNAEDACVMHLLSSTPAGPGDRCEAVGQVRQCAAAGAAAEARLLAGLGGHQIGAGPVGGVYDPGVPARNYTASTEGGRLVGEYEDDMRACPCASGQPACICASREAARQFLERAAAEAGDGRKDEGAKKGDDEAGKIVGIVVGGIVVIFCGVGVAIAMKKRRVQRGMNESMQRQLQMQQAGPAGGGHHPQYPPPIAPAPYPVAGPPGAQYPPPPGGQYPPAPAPAPGGHVYGVPAAGFPIVQPPPQPGEVAAASSSSSAGAQGKGGEPYVA